MFWKKRKTKEEYELSKHDVQAIYRVSDILGEGNQDTSETQEAPNIEDARDYSIDKQSSANTWETESLNNSLKDDDFLKQFDNFDFENTGQVKLETTDFLAGQIDPDEVRADSTLGPLTVNKLIYCGQTKLKDLANGKNEAIIIFSNMFGLTREEIVMRGLKVLSDKDREEYEAAINKRLQGMPLQYIVGEQSFYGHKFLVSPAVLIPRPETETVVEKAIQLLSAKYIKKPRILDLCTGSGVIGITLADRFPEALVMMTDISYDAIKIANENARTNGVSKRCQCLLGNLFDAIPEYLKYNLIISNPPYITSGGIAELDTEVRDYEPRRALDGGKDGLYYIKQIINEAYKHMAADGIIGIEIGDDQGEQVKLLMQNAGAYDHITVCQDLNGRDRSVFARLNNDVLDRIEGTR